MLRIFGRYFVFFAAAAVFGPLSAGMLQAADGVFYLLNYEDVAVSPRAKVIGVSEKLKRLARQSVPSIDKRPMREVFVQLTDGKNRKPFTYKTDRRGNLRIILPDSYDKLLLAPGSLPRLTGLMLFGRAGKAPELEKRFRNSWFVVGISRKAIGEMRPGRLPFAGYFPAAYALTSADHYPELEQLLAQPLPPEDTTLRLIYEEYCELLVQICARNGLFKAGLLTHLLDELEKQPDRTDMPELFRTYSHPVLAKKHPKIFPSGMSPEGLKNAYGEWFRGELDSMLNWNFLPASAGKIESRYLQTVRFEDTLKTTDGDRKDQEKIRIRGGLTELVRNYERLENASQISGEMLVGLSRLIKQAPPDLKIPVSEVRYALQIFVSSPSAGSGERVLQMERKFWQAVERNLVLEKFLSDAERDCTAPGARYFLTLRLIDYRSQPEHQPLRQLAELLEQTEREMGRQ